MQRTKPERIALTRRYVEKQERYYRDHFYHVWNTGYEVTPYMRGHWRKHSYSDCGRSQCQMCMNVRRCKWYPLEERLTLQERRHYDSFEDQLNDYHTC